MSHIPEEMRGLFLIRSRMGFRPSESRRLNVADLRLRQRDDLLDAYISLPPRSAKKKKARKLQLHPKVAAWLVERRKLNRFGAEPLFTNPNAQNDEGRWKESARDGDWSRHTRQPESPTSSPTRLAAIFSGLTPSTISKRTSIRSRNGSATPTPKRPSDTPTCARSRSPESSTQRRKVPQTKKQPRK
jgi:hypothetical protein